MVIPASAGPLRRRSTVLRPLLALALPLALAACGGDDPAHDPAPGSVTSPTQVAPSSTDGSQPEAQATSAGAGDASSGMTGGAQGVPGAVPADRPDSPDAGPVTIAVVGDLKLAHRAAEDLRAGRPDAPYAGVADELFSADLTLGNLETALGTGGDRQNKRFTFMAPPQTAGALKEAGFDYVSLANNHTYDFGVPGLMSTVQALREAGLPFSGAGESLDAAREPALLEANGRRIAVLSYVDVLADNAVVPFDNSQWAARPDRAGVAWVKPEHVAQDVAAAREQADDVLVMMHAGFENTRPPNDTQRALAKAALDAGATAVLGHHAHVLQGYVDESETGQFTAWGLGNFVFDGYPAGAEQTDAAILHLTIDDQGVTEHSFTPAVLVGGYPQAQAADSAQGARILGLLESLPK